MFVLTCPPPFPLEQGAQGGLFSLPTISRIPYGKPILIYSEQLQKPRSEVVTKIFTDNSLRSC